MHYYEARKPVKQFSNAKHLATSYSYTRCIVVVVVVVVVMEGEGEKGGLFIYSSQLVLLDFLAKLPRNRRVLSTFVKRKRIKTTETAMWPSMIGTAT